MIKLFIYHKSIDGNSDNFTDEIYTYCNECYISNINKCIMDLYKSINIINYEKMLSARIIFSHKNIIGECFFDDMMIDKLRMTWHKLQFYFSEIRHGIIFKLGILDFIIDRMNKNNFYYFKNFEIVENTDPRIYKWLKYNHVNVFYGGMILSKGDLHKIKKIYDLGLKTNFNIFHDLSLEYRNNIIEYQIDSYIHTYNERKITESRVVIKDIGAKVLELTKFKYGRIYELLKNSKYYTLQYMISCLFFDSQIHEQKLKDILSIDRDQRIKKQKEENAINKLRHTPFVTDVWPGNSVWIVLGK